MTQGQLFNPGPERPDPWALHPDDWVQRPDVVYHASDSPVLPRQDRGPGKNVGYGGSEGLHFGDRPTAIDRAHLADRSYIHTARLNADQFRPAEHPSATPGIKYPDEWDDESANYSSIVDKAVSEGKVVPYRNTFEGDMTTSYRAKPGSVRTWSEDVRESGSAHPALGYLADRGYNPTISKAEVDEGVQSAYTEWQHGKPQQQMFEADHVINGVSVAHGSEADMYNRSQVKTPEGRVVRYNGGVKRNNAMTEGWSRDTEAANRAVPKMRPTR